jgi:hypothetical protein
LPGVIDRIAFFDAARFAHSTMSDSMPHAVSARTASHSRVL